MSKAKKILIPLVTKKENDPIFLARISDALKDANEIILLLVIDSATMSRVGFATNEISQGNALMTEIKTYLESIGKKVEDIMEWGDSCTKIEHIALLKNVDVVFMKNHNSDYIHEIKKKLTKKTIKVELF